MNPGTADCETGDEKTVSMPETTEEIIPSRGEGVYPQIDVAGTPGEMGASLRIPAYAM
jgi:hypothetical protein